jgi:hypothetical protein
MRMQVPLLPQAMESHCAQLARRYVGLFRPRSVLRADHPRLSEKLKNDDFHDSFFAQNQLNWQEIRLPFISAISSLEEPRGFQFDSEEKTNRQTETAIG